MEYRGGENSSDSELDAVAEVCMPSDGRDGRSSSESSEGMGGRSLHNKSQRPIEKPPLGAGIARWIPRLVGSVRKAFSGPLEADLGEPNRYVYNHERQRWELSGGDDDGDDTRRR